MQRISRFLTDSRAVALPFAAVTIVMLLTVVGLVFDLGHLYVVKMELQTAADAGASAGASAMFALVGGSGPQPGTTLCPIARQTARDVVKENKCDGVLLNIQDGDAQTGIWAKDATTGKYGFTAKTDCTNSINAVQVKTSRTSLVNGTVPTLFAGFLNRQYTEVTATATALLGWVKNLNPGLGFPIALGKKYVPAPGNKMLVTFNPSTTDTGGWHSFNIQNASASVLTNLIDGVTKAPGVALGETINMTNGVDGKVVNDLKTQLTAHNGDWLVILPVVDPVDAHGNYNQTPTVLGFCAFEITSVAGPPAKTVTGWALGGYVDPNGNSDSISNSDTGLRASIPRLVQ